MLLQWMCPLESEKKENIMNQKNEMNATWDAEMLRCQPLPTGKGPSQQ